MKLFRPIVVNNEFLPKNDIFVTMQFCVIKFEYLKVLIAYNLESDPIHRKFKKISPYLHIQKTVHMRKFEIFLVEKIRCCNTLFQVYIYPVTSLGTLETSLLIKLVSVIRIAHVLQFFILYLKTMKYSM